MRWSFLLCASKYHIDFYCTYMLILMNTHVSTCTYLNFLTDNEVLTYDIDDLYSYYFYSCTIGNVNYEVEKI